MLVSRYIYWRKHMSWDDFQTRNGYRSTNKFQNVIIKMIATIYLLGILVASLVAILLGFTVDLGNIDGISILYGVFIILLVYSSIFGYRFIQSWKKQ